MGQLQLRVLGDLEVVRDGVALESRCFGEVCGTKDMRIGVENFLQNGPKSKAEFVHA